MARDSITDVSKILEKYFNDINDEVDKETLKATSNAVSDLRNPTGKKYKVRTGKYNKSWTFKIDKRYGNIEGIVYNAKHYQLTHLLEEGHAWVGRDGTRKENAAKPYPHITPTAEKISEEYEKAIVHIVETSGG